MSVLLERITVLRMLHALILWGVRVALSARAELVTLEMESTAQVKLLL